MKKITLKNKDYPCNDTETVLDALLRANVNVTFSCRNGICHSCLLQAKKGKPSAKSQTGLKPSLVKHGYFLACRCKPETDLVIDFPRIAEIYGRATICHKEQVAEDIWRIYLEPATSLYYHPGQFINIRNEKGVSRSFSLASIPNEDVFLELHIRRLPGGQMSNWLIDEAVEGSEVDFQGPLGECYYRNQFSGSPLLVVCTGTGLAPMIGIVRDAINHRHEGDIYIYHGSSIEAGLYLTEFMRSLDEVHANVHYIPCLSQQDVEGIRHGRASDIAFSDHADLSNWRVFIAGNPDMAYQAEELARKNGALSDNIFVDPFEFSRASNINGAQNGAASSSHDEINEALNNNINPDNEYLADPAYPQPDTEMWEALNNGELLTSILDDFYTQVYADEKLLGFFKDTTKRRSAEKQFNFLRRVFTGEKIYFGEKPRNAHNWMIISKQLFDYRENLMRQCLQKHGLPQHLIERWIAMEYRYIDVMVKEKPWKKIVDGVEYPVEGFGEIITEVGTLCDSCSREVAPGESISYHLRTGEVYCSDCKGSEKVANSG